MPNRNLFLTRTAIGAYISIIALFTSISPNIEALISRGKSESQKMDIRDWFAIALGITGTTSTLIGRYLAGNVYTPKGIPGIDPPDKPPDRLQ